MHSVKKQIHVAAGAIQDSSGRILITKRPDHVHQGGLWEFPGGKLESGETPEQGLDRELHEELGVRVSSSRPLIRVQHDYGDRRVLLDVHKIGAFAGEPRGREGQPLAWVHPEDMDPEMFPEADRPIITSLLLPALYLITGSDPLELDVFLARLSRALEGGVRLVQLRAHALSDSAYARLAADAYRVCEQRNARLLLNRDPDLVRDLPCHGFHLTGRRLWELQARPVGRELLVGASCHGSADLERAAGIGLDFAVLSPVKRTASHPRSEPLGWSRFASLVEAAGLPVYGLGGLRRGDVDPAIDRGAQGIAAIGGLWPVHGI